MGRFCESMSTPRTGLSVPFHGPTLARTLVALTRSFRVAQSIAQRLLDVLPNAQSSFCQLGFSCTACTAPESHRTPFGSPAKTRPCLGKTIGCERISLRQQYAPTPQPATKSALTRCFTCKGILDYSPTTSTAPRFVSAAIRNAETTASRWLLLAQTGFPFSSVTVYSINR